MGMIGLIYVVIHMKQLSVLDVLIVMINAYIALEKMEK